MGRVRSRSSNRQAHERCPSHFFSSLDACALQHKNVHNTVKLSPAKVLSIYNESMTSSEVTLSSHVIHKNVKESWLLFFFFWWWGGEGVN
jgi:hypothetical protein